MIWQLSISGYEWILGLAIVFGLAFFFTIIIDMDLGVFIAFLTFFDAFVVWVGLLPLWTLILLIIALTVIMYLRMKNKMGG